LVKIYGMRYTTVITADIESQEERRKREGSLSDFDPSSYKIHPNSRILKSKHRVRSKSDSESEMSSLTEPTESDEDEDEDEDGDFDSHATPPPRRSTRSKTALPFSPKKTRSQKVIPVDSDSDSGSGDADVEEPVVTRRSSRNKKTLKISMVDKNSDESTNEDQSMDYRPSKGSAPKLRRKANKPKHRPEYGVIHSVHDVADEYESDSEEAILHRHRQNCEKCTDFPTHVLLARSKGKPKKKRRRTDEFEESDEDLETKGGWVRW
jgi:chromodomain-helicase-DNA-binding protein 4